MWDVFMTTKTSMLSVLDRFPHPNLSCKGTLLNAYIGVVVFEATLMQFRFMQFLIIILTRKVIF